MNLNKKLNKFRVTKTKDRDLAKRLKSDSYFEYQTTQKITDFAKLLGYDFRHPPIYAIIDRSTFEGIDWKEASLFLRYENVYDIASKKYEWKQVTYTAESNILKHTFPLELKNKRKYKDKQFYSKDIDEDILCGMQYLKNNLCGCFFNKQSNVLQVDIDNHNQEGSLYCYQIMLSLLAYIKIEPFYSEISNEGGYHLFFKLDKEYSLFERKAFIDQFNKKYGYKIECPDKMRLPHSLTYTPINTEGEIFSYLNAIDNSIQLFNEQKGTSLSDIFIPETITTVLEKEKQKEKKEKVKTIESKVFCRQKKSKIKHFTPEEFLEETDISISKANRVEPMLEIIRTGKFNGWKIDTIVDVILKCNNPSMPSKDLSSWSRDRLTKEVEKIWKASTLYYLEEISSKPEEFVSNIDKIPSDILSLIDNAFIKLLIKQIYKNSKEYKCTKLNVSRFSIVFKEMIGSIFYLAQNNLEVKEGHSWRHLVGVQYSKQYCNLMKEFYPNLNTTDVWGIVNSILKYSEYFKQYKINSLGWKFDVKHPETNFCRQFDLFNNTNHILFKDRSKVSFLIFNSIKDYIINHSVISIIKNKVLNSNIITYYKGYFSNSYSVIRDRMIDFDVGLCSS